MLNKLLILFCFFGVVLGDYPVLAEPVSRDDIEHLIADLSCENDNQCKAMPFRKKACGGYYEHLLYSSKTVDEGQLKKAVDVFYRLNPPPEMSDCAFVVPPTPRCILGNCVAIPEGVDLLVYAVAHDDIRLVKALLDGKVEGYKPAPDLPAALPLAWSYKGRDGSLEMMEALLSLGADPDHDSSMAGIVSQNGDLDVLKLLLKHGMRHEEVMLSSVAGGHTDIVEYLLENGADVNLSDRREATLLMHASENGHAELVRFLIEKGARVNEADYQGETALIRAVRNGDLTVVNLLIEAGADIKQASWNGLTPLAAAMNNKVNQAVIDALLSRGADINFVSERSTRPLVLTEAVKSNDPVLVKNLIELGADVYLESEQGNALDVALLSNVFVTRNTPAAPKIGLSEEGKTANDVEREKNTQIIKMLLAEMPEIRIWSRRKDAPLQMAAAQNNVPAIKLLLEKGVDVNDYGKQDSSALILAVKNRQIEAVRVLLEAGADKKQKDAQGKEALDYATLCSCPAVRGRPVKEDMCVCAQMLDLLK